MTQLTPLNGLVCQEIAVTRPCGCVERGKLYASTKARISYLTKLIGETRCFNHAEGKRLQQAGRLASPPSIPLSVYDLRDYF